MRCEVASRCIDRRYAGAFSASSAPVAFSKALLRLSRFAGLTAAGTYVRVDPTAGCFSDADREIVSKPSTTRGTPRLLHKGTAQARWTEAGGRKMEARRMPIAAIQDQKKIRAAPVTSIRLIFPRSQSVRQERRIRNTAGNRR